MKDEKNVLQKMKDYFSNTPELKDLDVVEKNKIESKEGKDNFEEVTLADGVTIVNIEPAIEPNATITTKDEAGLDIPMPVGEYELADGRFIVVEVEGVILEVKEPTEEEAPIDEPVDEELDNDKSKGAEQRVRKVIESIVKESVFSLTEKINKLETENKFLHDENDAIKVKFAELKENTGIALKEVFEQPTKEPVKKKKNVFKKEETNIFVKQIKNK